VGTRDFKTAAFNHSAIPPHRSSSSTDNVLMVTLSSRENRTFLSGLVLGYRSHAIARLNMCLSRASSRLTVDFSTIELRELLYSSRSITVTSDSLHFPKDFRMCLSIPVPGGFVGLGIRQVLLGELLHRDLTWSLVLTPFCFGPTDRQKALRLTPARRTGRFKDPFPVLVVEINPPDAAAFVDWHSFPFLPFAGRSLHSSMRRWARLSMHFAPAHSMSQLP